MSEKGGWKKGGHFMAVLAVCNEFFEATGHIWVASAAVKGFLPMTNSLTQVQLLPNMIATG